MIGNKPILGTKEDNNLPYQVGEIIETSTIRVFQNVAYLLNENVKFPFVCTDFNSELATGKWLAVFDKNLLTDDYFTYTNAGFSCKSPTANTWVRNDNFISYDLRLNTSMGTTDHNLLVPNVYSVFYRVPQDCFLSDLTIRTPSAGTGFASIWSTAVDSETSTPISLINEQITGIAPAGFMGNLSFGETIPLLKGQYLHLFTSSSITSDWWNKMFIRFKKQ